MRRKTFPTPSTAGFTMLETLVIVAITGILFAISAPGWTSMVQRQQASAAKAQVLQTLRQAQSTARQKRASQIVKFDTTSDPPQLSIGNTFYSLGQGNIKPGAVRLAASSPSIIFDSLGNVPQSTPIPYYVTVSVPNSSNSKQCVAIQSLIGAITELNGNACP